ncbi:uncharacterized protein LOC116852720 isoform X2 [Odontomachus brunneus]|uniref:uncharacterized protein LOC116852720 isoform X2 n=1 Tax=Odontomachus brunneus TaxID=486640 RepID=UPI0013F1AEC8|nr:uncharacterized protein LOC116852720 isoform X2 [Odontomachus brunneus]
METRDCLTQHGDKEINKDVDDNTHNIFELQPSEDKDMDAQPLISSKESSEKKKSMVRTTSAASGIDDSELDAEFIKQHLRPTYNWRGEWRSPISVERLRKRTPDPDALGGYKMINTNTFIGIFENFCFPSFVFLLGKKIFLKPFAGRVIRCTHCHRFGHLRFSCKKIGMPMICGRCAGEGHSDQNCLSDVVLCINYERNKLANSDHHVSSVNCPVYIHNKHVKRVMAVHCLGPLDAENFIKVSGLTEDNHSEGSSSITLDDFWPKIINKPSAVSYAEALKSSKKNKTALPPVGPGNKIDGNVPTSVSPVLQSRGPGFLSFLHVVRRKRAERRLLSAAGSASTVVAWRGGGRRSSRADGCVASVGSSSASCVGASVGVDCGLPAVEIAAGSGGDEVRPRFRSDMVRSVESFNQKLFSKLNASDGTMSKSLLEFLSLNYSSTDSNLPNSTVSLGKSHISEFASLIMDLSKICSSLSFEDL